jgi:1-acyl-sn-glycerol-3-phosphate acyltransferase
MLIGSLQILAVSQCYSLVAFPGNGPETLPRADPAKEIGSADVGASIAGKGPVLYFVLHLILKPLTRLIYRPVIEGADKVPREGPLILASNHLSFIDSIVIPLVAPRRIFYLAKAEYFGGRGPVNRLRDALFRTLGAIPVDRAAARSAQASLDAALQVLKAGDAFGIYPEGTRSRDGRLYRGHTGVAWLAINAHAPVVPVGLIGTDAIMPVGSRFPRIKRVTVRFGDPLNFEELAATHQPAVARRMATDAVMDAIAELSGQQRVPTYNQLPTAE